MNRISIWHRLLTVVVVAVTLVLRPDIIVRAAIATYKSVKAAKESE